MEDPDADAGPIDGALRALAEPRRRDILELVTERARSVGEIASRFDVSRPAISQHLAVLEQAGLVSVRSEGTKRLYRTRPEGLAAVQRYLQQFWGAQLESLKRAAERDEDPTP